MAQKTNAQLQAEFVANLPDNITGLITPAIFRQTMIDFLNSIPTMLDVDQSLSGGANITPFDNGTVSSGTLTIDCGKCPLQKVVNNGAFTLAAPVNDGSCMLLVTNGASAGAITFSGFSVGGNTGDSLDTTNTHKFSLSIWRISGTPGYRAAAHQ